MRHTTIYGTYAAIIAQLRHNANSGSFSDCDLERAAAEAIERLSQQVAALRDAVKEEDARVCEGMPIMFGKARLTSPDDCADAIRASIKEVK